MKLTLRGTKYYLVKRVPTEFRHVDSRIQVWKALKTDSLQEAQRRAIDAERDLENQWLMKSSGNLVCEHSFFAAQELALARGFTYVPLPLVAQQTTEELFRRVEAAAEGKSIAKAVLGAVPKPKHKLSAVLGMYFELSEVDVKDKGHHQRRIWENVATRTMKRLIRVVGDKYIDDLTREDALAFRSHWAERINLEGLSPSSANRELASLGGVFSKLHKLKGIGDHSTFKNLAFPARKKVRLPYDQDYIRDRILPALNKGDLNEEAANIVRILINSGMRPSEVCNLTSECIFIDSEIPHVSIQPRPGRELKTQTSIRMIPLVGIALEAAKAHQNGFPRYADKEGNFCNAANKFLTTFELRPSKQHSIYSFRHGFQDRLTALEAPDRLQADLMGHRYVRERYGQGPSLRQKRDWLLKMSF